MICLILAAGYATRLYPLTENFPKPLLKVCEKTIIDWLVDDILSTGKVDEFIVISNHKFYNYFKEWAYEKKVKVSVFDDGTSTNETRLGAVRDIELVIDKLKLDDDMLVIAGDNVLDFSLEKFIEFSENKDTSCVMTYKEIDLTKKKRTAIITFNLEGLIESYEEKPENPKGDYAVPPFYFFKKADIKRISEAISNGCDVDAPGSFAAWLSKKVKVHAFIMPGNRYDIGNADSYRKVQSEYRGIIM